MSKTVITAEPGTQTTTITREFDAPPEFVYRAHVEPDLLVQWLGPRKYRMAIDHYDVRHGGSYRYTHSDDQGNSYAFRGVFHGEPSLDGITQTFEFEGVPGHVALETATFEDLGGRTRLRIESVYQSVADRDGMVESGMEVGINDGYARLDELLSRLRATAGSAA
jgi:uncharacterized protein YndB with AHSA1/START domain